MESNWTLSWDGFLGAVCESNDTNGSKEHVYIFIDA